MSTLALEGSDARDGGGALRYADLAVLALALPVFVLAGLPLLGYAVAAGAWLAQRGAQIAFGRRVKAALSAGDRQTAVGTLAATTLGRVWLVAGAVLAVGLLGDRENGLAAAVLATVLFTAYLAGEALAHALDRERGR